MNYIPYPRQDKNNHTDLVSWRAKINKIDGDWTNLKTYLSDNCRILNNIHPITKCWYSELQQGDNYALDVEHFRPKNSAFPLNDKDVKEISEKTKSPFLQDKNTTQNYPWLKFEYRNYRIVTALTNRAGAKHIYFPIFENTKRLVNAQEPWNTDEYNFFLDPTNKRDTTLLFVKPNGEIEPLAKQTELTQNDINNLPHSWENDAFNYVRALVTIKMYRLNEKVFIEGRKEIYDAVKAELDILIKLIEKNVEEIMEMVINKIVNFILPSAQFSLAARCSINNYVPDEGYSQETLILFEQTIQKILNRVDQLVNQLQINWDND